jgi:CheY-like chemotaxis protein
MAVSETLIAQLRAALRALYDPAELRSSALVSQLGLVQRDNPALALRDLLTRAVEAMRPGSDVPADARAWRYYEVLLCRYVQQCGQQEAADQLGLGVRHVRREERAAIEVLASRLATQYRLAPEATMPAETDAIEADRNSYDRDLAWLHTQQPGTETDVVSVLRQAIALMGPVAQQHRVALLADLPTTATVAAVNSVALRQTLLSALQAAIDGCGASQLRIACCSDGRHVQVVIEGKPEGNPQVSQVASQENLALAHTLSAAVGGRLEGDLAGDCRRLQLSLPLLCTVPIMVIDDTQDALQLYKRYVVGTRYQLLPFADPRVALAEALAAKPAVVLIDVVMPQIDGWEALGWFRSQEALAGVPLIVCTILAQEELARSLGASGYLRKPVTRAAFLAALDAATAGPTHRAR